MRRSLALVIAIAAGVIAAIGVAGVAGAISSGSISPTTLTSSGQAITVTYAGKDTSGAASNLVVEECIANDSKPGFDPNGVDCSPLSRQTFFGVAASGSVNYGGNPGANPYAPFVGTDPNNGEWSVCSPDSGVTNYQSGYFRIADSPDDQADDVFVPFQCDVAEVPDAPLPVLLPAGAVIVMAGAYLVVRRRTRGDREVAA